MKLYKISITKNDERYDYYDSAIVVAENEDMAKRIHPDNANWATYYGTFADECKEWVKNMDEVTVVYVGEPSPNLKIGVVLASYNAG